MEFIDLYFILRLLFVQSLISTPIDKCFFCFFSFTIFSQFGFDIIIVLQ